MIFLNLHGFYIWKDNSAVDPPDLARLTTIQSAKNLVLNPTSMYKCKLSSLKHYGFTHCIGYCGGKKCLKVEYRILFQTLFLREKKKQEYIKQLELVEEDLPENSLFKSCLGICLVKKIIFDYI
jgi:hypothetical protein